MQNRRGFRRHRQDRRLARLRLRSLRSTRSACRWGHRRSSHFPLDPADLFQPRKMGARRLPRVEAHSLCHSCAMELLHNGVDRAVIVLWLGHESVETTYIYLHADLKLKEQAMARTSHLHMPPARYRPDDDVLTFLNNLRLPRNRAPLKPAPRHTPASIPEQPCRDPARSRAGPELSGRLQLAQASQIKPSVLRRCADLTAPRTSDSSGCCTFIPPSLLPRLARRKQGSRPKTVRGVSCGRYSNLCLSRVLMFAL